MFDRYKENGAFFFSIVKEMKQTERVDFSEKLLKF